MGLNGFCYTWGRMKSARALRPLTILILALVALAFLGGTFRLIDSAHAARASQANPASHHPAEKSEAFLGAGETSLGDTGLAQAALSTQLPTDTPEPVMASADTTGIIALAILILATIVLGAGIGMRGLPPRKKTTK